MSAAPPPTRTLWYADGLRWIGGLLNGAADRLDRIAARPPLLSPSEYRAIDEYVNDLRSRVHLNG